MPENQVELNNNRKKQIEKFFDSMPDTAGQIVAQMDAAYKDGAIDRKTKHLMALAIALGVGCRKTLAENCGNPRARKCPGCSICL